MSLIQSTVPFSSQQPQEDSARDFADFKAWLLKDDRGEETHYPSEPFYKFFYSMLQEMSQFRFRAEEYYRNNTYLAKSKNGELPLKREYVKEYYFPDEENKEPPETVISRVAQHQYYAVQSTLEKIRKMLRRERQQTHVSKIQQIDTQCLVWWTRQPGITPAQKAGMKQKLLAVVRNESYDILENRVLKEVLKLCVAYCRRYLKQYDSDQFHGSDRIQAVRRLYNTAQQGLQMDVMQSISPLGGMPQPNYVLLHDKNYSQVWTIYRNLLNQTALMEYIWKNRISFFQQYLLFCLSCSLDFEEPEKIHILFDSDYWFSGDFKKDGCFLKNTSFLRLFLLKKARRKDVFRFDYSKGHADEQGYMYIKRDQEYVRKIVVLYLPANASFDTSLVPTEDKLFYFVFSETQNIDVSEREDVKVIELNNTVLFYEVNDWIHGLLEELRVI